MNLAPSRSPYAFDVDKYLDMASRGEILEEIAVKLICVKVKEILLDEENVKNVQAPVTVVGDVHG